MREAVLEVDIARDWRQDLVERFDATVGILECLGSKHGGCDCLVDIKVPPGWATEAVAALRSHQAVRAVDLDVRRDGAMRGRVRTSQCYGCRAAIGKGTFVLDSFIGRNGRLVLRLLVEGHEEMRAIIARYEAAGHHAELLSLGRVSPRELLSSRQEDLLETAYDLGYFDDPKGVGLRELSRMFGVSVSTVAEILRTGLRKLMGSYFEGRAGVWSA
jgi:predicted DNA binding protein